MKKIVFLLSLLLIFSVASAQQAVDFEPLQITLWADTQAGYGWSSVCDESGVLADAMPEVIEQSEGSDYIFNYSVLKAGNAEVYLNYGPETEIGVPDRSITLDVTVDEGGSCSVKRLEVYPDDRMLVITMPAESESGLSWNYLGESENGGIVSLVNQSAAEDAHSVVFQMRAEKSGDTVLMFGYSDPWQPSSATDEIYTVIVNVSEEMDISVSVGR